MSLSLLVKTTVNNCKKKPICKTCPYFNNQFVLPHHGQSGLVVIEEFPTRGRGHAELLPYLSEVGFDLEDITFLSAVSCSPLLPQEINKKAVSICSKNFLESSLSSATPKLVLLVGSLPFHLFFDGYSMLEKHGSILNKDGTLFMPIMLPAKGHNEVRITDMIKKDLLVARKFLLNEPTHPSREYTLIKTESDLKKFEFLRNSEMLAVDIETNDLDPFSKESSIWTIAFCYDKNKAVCVPLGHVECVNVTFKKRCEDFVRMVLCGDSKKVFHNATFDVKWLNHFGYSVKNLHADTMVMAHYLNEHRSSLSLKALAAEYLNGCRETMSSTLSLLADYNMEDTDNTFQLYNLFYSEFQKFPKLWSLMETVVFPMLEVIVEMETNGTKIDLEYSKSLSERVRQKKQSLIEYIHEKWPIMSGIDIDSPKQLSEVFFVKLGLDPIKKTKTGYSVDADTLKQLSSKSGLAKRILAYRKAEKLLNTYIDKLPTMVGHDGRVRGKFHLTRTRSYRLASSNPNLQNIPREKAIRNMFVAERGKVLLNYDAAQAEVRIIASIAPELVMIEAFNKNKDLHRITASRVLGVPVDSVSDEDRQKAKGTLFGLLYGSSPEGFQNYAQNEFNIKFSLEDCKKIHTNFFLVYPGLRKYFNDVENHIRQYGRLVYPCGAIARFDEYKGMYDIPASVLRQGYNLPVQGSSSLIVNYVMSRIRKIIKCYKLDVKILSTVHDSILFESELGNMSILTEEINNICQFDIPKLFPWLRVPMIFDCAYGEQWGNLKKVK